MDRKTFTQFLLICTVILVCWWGASYLLYGPASKRAGALPPAPAPQEQALAPAAGAQAPGAVGQVAAPPQQPQTPAQPVETAELKNSHLKLVWTNQGASLRTLTILDSKYLAPYVEGDKRPPLTLLSELQAGMFSDTIETVTFTSRPDPKAPSVRLDVPTADLVYRLVQRGPDKLIFELTVSDGKGHTLLIRKTVSLPADAYDYDVSLDFENVSDTPYEVEFALRGAAGIEREALQPNDVGTRVSLGKDDGYKIMSQAAQKLLPQDAKPNESKDITWAGVINHYFVALTVPKDAQWISSVSSDLVTEDALLQAAGRWDTPVVRRQEDRRSMAANATVVIHTVPLSLTPKAVAHEWYTFIAAPKDRTVLAQYDAGVEGLIEFGYFGYFSPISRAALWILNAIHAVLPNYGVAILALTVLVRLLIFPLTRKQLVGMIKMQKLQPQIAELQRQYADDKQKLTTEQMALFKKYGVHPLSGCGPLLLQFPILVALWTALNASINLRQAGFLWIADLSRPDTIYHFPFYIPVLWNELNLLPFLMAGAMFWQQKNMPMAGGEQAQQQQKIMKYLPFFFVLMFYHMSSGLTLYWTATSGLGLVERWVIYRRADSIELKPKGERKPRTKPGGKPAPTWLDKLQKLVEDKSGTGQQRKGKS